MAKSPFLKIYGLIGYPVRHSFSPAMHNAAFKALNINAEYKLFEVSPEELQDFLLSDNPTEDVNGNFVSKEDIFGFNITIPHKVKAKEILEKEFPSAQDTPLVLENLYYVKLSGAINTVKKAGKELKYFNTDATGFFKSLTCKESLCFDFEPRGKNILLIGCGGAGRAIIASLSWINVGVKKIYINDINDKTISSTKEHFQQLTQYPHLEGILEFISIKDIPRVIKDCQLLINASPVGMKEFDGSAIDKNLLHENLYVYDVVYNRETQLIKDAKSQGLTCMDGRGMLLYQGAEAFEFWTGERAPIDLMRQALEKELEICRK